MTVCETEWQTLEADHRAGRVTSRRLHPESAHDLFLQIVDPGALRALTLRTDSNSAAAAVHALRTLPRTRGLDLRFATAVDGRRDLQVVLLTADLREVFNPLVSDIVQTVQAVPGPTDAVLAAVDRFEHWRRLLHSVADEGLSAEGRRGLYGELVVLSDHVLPALPALSAIRAWTGPTGAHQDFQLPAVAIEVKTTTAKQPQALEIASERELDDRGVGTLLLAHISVDERQGGTGTSLNSIVDTIRNQIAGSARSVFEDLLLRAGYLPAQRRMYDEPRYTRRTNHVWQVAGDFPRIVEIDLRSGVGDCRYRITISGLDSYLLDNGKISSIVGGGP